MNVGSRWAAGKSDHRLRPPGEPWKGSPPAFKSTRWEIGKRWKSTCSTFCPPAAVDGWRTSAYVQTVTASTRSNPPPTQNAPSVSDSLAAMFGILDISHIRSGLERLRCFLFCPGPARVSSRRLSH